jgi:hypothetical protein
MVVVPLWIDFVFRSEDFNDKAAFSQCGYVLRCPAFDIARSNEMIGAFAWLYRFLKDVCQSAGRFMAQKFDINTTLTRSSR